MSPCCCGSIEVTAADVLDAINRLDGEKLKLEGLAEVLDIYERI